MSLTSIINTPETRSFLKDKIHNPGIDPEPETLIPPEAASPRRVGMAFDYALRGGLEARFDAATRGTVAESGLAVLQMLGSSDGEDCDLDEATERLERAMARLGDLGTEQELSDSAVRGCYHLADLETVYRAKRTDDVGREVTDREVQELRGLYEIIPWDVFEPNERLYLNPTFGEASRAVGGADADVVVDDTIVDLKTIKRQRPKIKMFRQLVGYALFAQRFGLNREGEGVEVDRVAIYFSRAGELRTWPLSEVLEAGTEDAVVEYFLDF